MTTDHATPQPRLDTTARKTRLKKMRGFTLIELGIVLTIVAILALFALPRVQGYLINGRVQPTASETSAAVSSIRTLAATATTTAQPYAGMTNTNFVTAFRDRANALILDLINNKVYHRIGAPNSTVTFAPATITTLGDSFTIVFLTVNGAACADLATALQVQARDVSIKPGALAAVNVKTGGGAFDPVLSQTTCATGDVNTLTFTFQ